MDFSSPFFLYYFIPVVLILFHLAPLKHKKLVLISSSLLFYAWGATWFLFILLITLGFDYWLAQASKTSSEKSRKKILLASIFINTFPLLFYKLFYESSVTSETVQIVIPIGLTMIYLQRIAYSIEIFRNINLHFEDIQEYAVFHLFFPKLITGPLTKLEDFGRQIKQIDTENMWDDLFIGGKRFAIGFCKKIIVVNTLFSFTGLGFEKIGSISSGESLLVLFAFSIQILFEVSAYADMAVGLSKMFGFNLPENFKSLLCYKGIRDFWQNSFITIYQWFKTNLLNELASLIPKKAIRYGIVFLITIGLLGFSTPMFYFITFHALFFLLEKKFLGNVLSKIGPIFSGIYSFALITFSWIFFKSESSEVISVFFYNLFGNNEATYSLDFDSKFYYILIIALTLGIWNKIPFLNSLSEKMNNNGKIEILKSCAIAALFIFAVSYATTLNNPEYTFLRF